MDKGLRKAQETLEKAVGEVKDKFEELVAGAKKSGIFSRIWGFIKSIPGKIKARFKKIFG